MLNVVYKFHGNNFVMYSSIKIFLTKCKKINIFYLIFLIFAITAATFEAAIDDDFIVYSSLSSLNKFIICLVVSLSLTPSSSNTYPKYSEIIIQFNIYIHY